VDGAADAGLGGIVIPGMSAMDPDAVGAEGGGVVGSLAA